jgi:hypothetical protein
MKKKIDEKRAITPRWVFKFTSKLQDRYFVLYFKNYLEIDVKFIAKMCSISRSTYPAILK